MGVLKIKDNGTWVNVSTTTTVFERNSIYLKDVPCSAMTGDFVSTTDFRINSNSTVTCVTFANPSAITSDLTWSTSTGAVVLNGTCSTATTCDIQLANCSTPSDYENAINESGSGYCKMPDGTLLQWGSKAIAANSTNVSITFDIPFASANAYSFTAIPRYQNSSNVVLTIASQTASSISVYRATSTSYEQSVVWQAIGRWK